MVRTYSTYLRLEELLDLQSPASGGEEHDEMLLKARALLEAVASAAAQRPSVEEILASGYLPPPGEWAPRTLSAVAWRG